MAMLRKLFFRKPPDGLLEICERVYVFDCCFTTDAWNEENYKVYMDGIVGQLRENLPDASILIFNFREENTKSQVANIMSEYDITIMDYPRHYEGCPLLKMELIHHFLRSSESWLSLSQHNVLLMHCERGGWPVLAFMLAALLIYRKVYTGEQRTLEMVYRQSPHELLHLLTPLNPVPSQLRYLQYVSRRNVALDWPPLDRALMLDCVILRFFPNFDEEGGCHPLFRVYGQDPFSAEKNPKMLYSTPKRSKNVRAYKQGDCELIKIDMNCHIQGDVVIESVNLHGDMEREKMMFRVMFNTAFVRSNILMLNRDEIDILWDAKDHFPRDFRAEILFSEMDAAAAVSADGTSCFEEKEGLPIEAFAKVQEIFSHVDWMNPKADAALNVLQQISASAMNDRLDTVSDQHVETGSLLHETGPRTPHGNSNEAMQSLSSTKRSPDNDMSKREDKTNKVEHIPQQPSASNIIDQDTPRSSEQTLESNKYPPSTNPVIKPQAPHPALSCSVDTSFSPRTPPLRPQSTSAKEVHGSPRQKESPPYHLPLQSKHQSQDRSQSSLSSKNVNSIPPIRTRLEYSTSPPPTPPTPPTPPLKDHRLVQGKPPPPSPLKKELHVKSGPFSSPLSSVNVEPQVRDRPSPPPPSPLKEEQSVRFKPPPPPPPLPPPCLSGKVASSTLAPPPPPPPPTTTTTAPSPPLSSAALSSNHSNFSLQKSPADPAVPAPPPPPGAPAPPPPPGAPAPPPPPGAPAAPPPPIPIGKGGLKPGSGDGNSVSGTTGPRSSSPTSSKGRILSRTISSKNNTKKLKPLHWLKLSRAVQGSLWAETQKSGEASRAPEIDMSELENLFSATVPNSGAKKSNVQNSAGPKSDKVQLVEHRRAYNCEIMLSKVKVPLHDLMSSVLALEESALDTDQVENLIKFCPTKEEMELLKGYNGETEKLGRCEQFLMELMKVPRVESKLRVFSFKIQFHSQVSDVRNSLNVVNAASEEIRNSIKLKRIMQTILSLGNALNQGTARGSAIGFRLDSLLKLTETRARDRKMTLMHYLCKVLVDKLPEVLDFSKDLANLEPAAKVQLKFLAEEMQALNKGLEKVVQELSTAENDGPISETFREKLKEFLCSAEAEVRSLASLYSSVGRNVDKLILYFGEDPARCPFEQVVSTLLNFTRMFNKAHEENSKQLELEMKKTADSEKKRIMSSNLGKVMSVVTDSPVHSSSSDDFAAFLDGELDASSPSSSPDKEDENQDELESIRIKRRKVESIEETEGSTSEGIIKQNLEASVEVDVCAHPGSFGNMCIRCGQKMDGESGVTFGYIHKGLRLHDEEISRLRSTDMKSLLCRKKLYLVLDLDHTLLNSTHLAHLSSDESHLFNQTDSLADVSKGSLFKLEHMHMMTKLRPFVRPFLKEASELFEMYIYTMGERPYALEMAKLLDPQGEYFNSKVISRDDGTQKHQKGLDVVLGQESAVLILDDTEHAWKKHKDNLILMERYHFFASSCWQFNLNCQSLAQLKSDEDETDGALAKILKLLKQVHCKFFDKRQDNLVDRDVRQVLSSVRSEVLSGCVIVFSRINHGALESLQKMAELLGATCVKETDYSVTHVVATDAGTEKARWAVKEKRFLVHPRWIEAANYFWEKQPEENFVLKKKQ